MAFLVVKKTDSFRIVYEGDPAIRSQAPEGSDPSWILEDSAECESGERPDVFVCRPLGADEVLRIINALDVDASLVVQAAAIGVVRIEQADGKVIEEAKEVREVLNLAQNMNAITSLAQTIFEASREGLDSLPFRS